MKAQAARGSELSKALPFTFVGTAHERPNGFCAVLESLSCHNNGAWRVCCSCGDDNLCAAHDSAAAGYHERINFPLQVPLLDAASLPSVGIEFLAATLGYLPPIRISDPPLLASRPRGRYAISSWSDYYRACGLPLASPAAALLHWPLLVYRALQLAAARGVDVVAGRDVVTIHYLGGMSRCTDASNAVLLCLEHHVIYLSALAAKIV